MNFNREILIGSPKKVHMKDKERPEGEIATDEEVQDIIGNIFN